MDVEVLTVSACPNRSLALARVREALDRVGASGIAVAERVVDDLAVARAAGMHGSPTIRVDGRDPFPCDSAEASVSCRLYRTDSGLESAPSLGALVDALSPHGSDIR
jgi:hypothetical protein